MLVWRFMLPALSFYLFNSIDLIIQQGGCGHSKFSAPSLRSELQTLHSISKEGEVIPNSSALSLRSELQTLHSISKKGEVIPSFSAPSLRSELQTLHSISKEGEAIPSFSAPSLRSELQTLHSISKEGCDHSKFLSSFTSF